MDLSFIESLYSPTILVICLCMGYVMKHWMNDVNNKIIPTVLAVVGVVLSCLTQETITVELVCSGLVTGLASTGLHQAFKQIIEKK